MAGGLAIGGGGWRRQQQQHHHHQQQQAAGGGGQEHKCLVCYDDANFHLTCCDSHACAFCLRELVLKRHAGADPVCRALTVGCLVPLTHPQSWPLGASITTNAYEHTAHIPPWYYAESARKDGRVYLFYYNLHDLEEGRDPRVMEIVHLVYPAGGLSGRSPSFRWREVCYLAITSG